MRPFVLILMLGLAWSRAAAQTEYTLDDFDQWKPAAGPQTVQPMLQQAQLALANNEPQRALALADNFMEQNPLSSARSDALLIRGDALLAMDSEWQALFAYEEIARRYATTSWFVPALEREFEIAKAYAHGLRKKFFGTFRVIEAGDDAQEILIRIQERLPGSALAEKAGMALADFYYERRDMALAADAYDLFVQNYPRSLLADKARLRLIAAYCSSSVFRIHSRSPVQNSLPTSTTGNGTIFSVWISVSASNSSSIVPKPPGKMMNPRAYLTNITLRTKK